MSPDAHTDPAAHRPLSRCRAKVWLVHFLVLGVSILGSWSAALVAQSPRPGQGADLRGLFSKRAPLSAAGADGGDLVRLPLPTDVLSSCRADLSDLRILDGEGALPFVLRRSTEARRVLREPAVIRSAQRSTTGPSGPHPTAQVQAESYTLEAPPSWSDSGDWVLRIEVDPSRGSFARDVELGWADENEPATQLRATIFRLRSGVEVDEVAIPPRTGRRLGVRLVGQDVAASLDPLEPRFVFQRTEEARQTQSELDLELDFELQPDEGDEFMVQARLPAGVLAESLRFETSTRTLRRRVTVTEVRADGSEQLLGQSWIQRVGDPGGSAASMKVALVSGSREVSPTDTKRTLRIAIDGGDSPPLDALRVFAEMTRPELVFEWPSSGAAQLYFGGGRARPPRFDLQLAADRRRFQRASSDVTWSLLTDTNLEAVELGEITNNPDFDDAPLLAFLQRPGRRIALSAFGWVSTLELPEEASGLYRVALGPQTLSRVRSDFADLRFVAFDARDQEEDQGAAQWPYLVAPADDWSLDLVVGSTEELPDRTSRVELRLPESIGDLQASGALLAETLELTFGQAFFDREVRLSAVSDGAATELLSRRVTTGRAQEAFFSRRTTSRATFDISSWADQAGALSALRLEIEDGDDAPSKIRAARLTGPGRQALVVAKPGPIRAVFGATGNESLEAPTYELQRARDLVQSLRGRELELSPTVANRDARRPGALQQLAGDWQDLLLWAAILLAVLALGWITLRSVRT